MANKKYILITINPTEDGNPIDNELWSFEAESTELETYLEPIINEGTSEAGLDMLEVLELVREEFQVLADV